MTHYLVNEEIPAVVGRVHHSSLLDLTPDTVAEGVLVLLSAQVSDVAGGQQIVDVHQELLIHNLVVSHQEGNCSTLHTSLYATKVFVSYSFLSKTQLIMAVWLIAHSNASYATWHIRVFDTFELPATLRMG